MTSQEVGEEKRKRKERKKRDRKIPFISPFSSERPPRRKASKEIEEYRSKKKGEKRAGSSLKRQTNFKTLRLREGKERESSWVFKVEIVESPKQLCLLSFFFSLFITYFC